MSIVNCDIRTRFINFFLEMISSTLILTFIVLGVFIYYWFFKNDNNGRKLPPGPRSFPLIGNLLQLDKELPYKTFAKWAKEYGPIFKAKIGPPTYIINDHKLVKDLFSSDVAFSGRMDIGDATAIFQGKQKYGIIDSEGEHWEQIRRFTLRQLRDFGFGKNTMESLILDELKDLMDWMKAHEGSPIDNVKEKMILAVVNSLWTIISGKRHKHDDPTLIYLTGNIQRALVNATETGGIVFFIPWLAKLIPELSGYNKLRKGMDSFAVMFGAAVQEHKSTYSESFQRDFIDVFIKEIKASKDKGSAFHGEFGERQLIAVISDLFIAGSDTTSTTLSWAFLYLSTFPEVQKKLQREVETVTGSSRQCLLSDRPNLPYAEALIAEVLRYSSLASLGVPHKVLIDKEFQGYFYPKGTIIMANLHYIHNDPKIWGDPFNFRPERFLSPEGVFKKHDALMPFLIGRRQCIGETLARDTLFLYLTNIFQRFNVTFDPASTPAQRSLDPAPGFMLNPRPYKVILTEN